jgi:hypothetical protein
MQRLLRLILLASALAPQVKATLVTPNYTIHITELCKEDVACNRVIFESVDKSGKTKHLKGKRLVVMCADGLTPCHPYGYEFYDGPARYVVSDEGEFTETLNGKTLIDENGNWQND